MRELNEHNFMIVSFSSFLKELGPPEIHNVAPVGRSGQVEGSVLRQEQGRRGLPDSDQWKRSMATRSRGQQACPNVCAAALLLFAEGDWLGGLVVLSSKHCEI